MKIKNLYNLDSFEKFFESGKASGFKDSAAGVVLERNLTAVDPKIFEKKYPDLALMNSGIDIDNSGGYARRIQSLRLREQGQFSTAGDASANKGKISISAEDSYLNVLVREAFSKWNDDEVKESDLQNINLVSEFLKAHNKVYQREIDEVGLLGIPDVTASTGLLNYAGFTSGGASGAISSLNAQQTYDEFAEFITAQWSAVNNTESYMANNVIMPVSIMNTLMSTMMDTASGTKPVINALRDNFKSVNFLSTFRAQSVSATTVVVAFSSSDEVMKMRVPVPLTIGEIVKISSFDFQVDSKYRIAGLDVLENAGGRILTGL